MKFKGTVVLMVTFIGIVLYYFLIDVPTEERKRKETIRSEKVLPFNSNNVTAFSIVKEKKAITLKRSGTNEWQMTKPVGAKGDFSAISTFLSFLNNLNFTRIVEESTKDLSTFGLDGPILTITLSMKNGETKGIRVGDDHPMGNKIYLARLNEDRVLRADITRDRFEQRAYDLRDKTILNFETSKIKRLNRVRHGKTLTLKKTKKSWQLSQEETTAKGDENKITNFMNTIQTARIKDFVDEQPEQLASYGLSDPELIVKLIEQDTNNSLVLSIGKKVDNGFYAKALSRKNVFLIDPSLFDTINNSRLTDFMDKSLVDFKAEELTAMTLRMGKEVIQLTRDSKDSKKWAIEKPVNAQANMATVNSLIFDLKRLRIVEFINKPTEKSKLFGLDRPEKEITLTYKSGKKWSLALGNQTSGVDHYFARRTDEETIFTLKKSATETIFRTLHDLRDRKLLTFNGNEIYEIKIRNTKQTFVLQKYSKKWKLVQPESIGSVKSSMGNDILWTLSSLEFESPLPMDPGNELTGLKQPLLSVELLSKKSAVLGHLLIGKSVVRTPELHYLKVGKNQTIYTVKKRILDEIPSSINKFKSQNPSK